MQPRIYKMYTKSISYNKKHSVQFFEDLLFKICL